MNGITSRITNLFLIVGIATFASPAALCDEVPHSTARSGDLLRRADALIERASFEQAAKILRALADHGVAPAITRLGILHHLGRGVPEDDTKAFRLFERAAAAGDAEAMFWVARMTLLGQGPPRDDPDADRNAAVWFFEAARRGHAEAQYYLGILFLAGTGVERSPREAQKWFSRAAASGHDAARQFTEQRDAQR